MDGAISMVLKIVKWLCIVVGVIYVGILLLLMSMETTLIYPGSKFPNGDWDTDDFEFEEVEFASADGTKLVGWFLPRDPDSTDPPRVVLHSHGNGENAAQSSAWMGNRLRKALDADVFVYDYRGFGKSEGTPFEAGVLADGEAALAWLEQRTGTPPAQTIISGTSLGGGIAVHLASTFGCKALILQRTFSSIEDIAQQNYPWLPIRYVIRNRYPSIEKISSYPGPVIQSHGTADRSIPIAEARKLFAAAPTRKKEFVTIEGMGHNEAQPDSYWATLKRFVDELE